MKSSFYLIEKKHHKHSQNQRISHRNMIEPNLLKKTSRIFHHIILTMCKVLCSNKAAASCSDLHLF